MPELEKKPQPRHAAIKVRLVSDNEERRHEVRGTLQKIADPPLDVTENGLPSTNDGAAPTNGGPATDLVMVVFGDDDERALNYLQSQADSTPRPALFALMEERSPALMRRALRAGADELLFLPLEPRDVTRALIKVVEAHRRSERREGGLVCSIMSTLGGVGVTSLSANLALALRYQLEKRVALVDLDLQMGGLAVFLNLEPERNIMALAQMEQKLDSIQLESALTKHDSGVYLLAAPRRIEDSEMVTDQAVGDLLDLMRQLFDFVIVDCGGYVNEPMVAAWEHSDQLLYLIDQSVAGARCAWRFLELIGRLGLREPEPKFVLSRYVANHPITEAQIAQTLARPVYVKLPRDEKALERVQLKGLDLWKVAPTSPLTHAVEDLARKLAQVEIAAVAEGNGHVSIMSRLLSAIGQARPS